ncbi:hypothetical protein ABT126_13890 [Streptomyces sp. NPDC002012]|uniref:hypothetical protein n=1 Tax=Streptomyces sp. NPDC002012 TaxID=3154532 RepID=UPI00332D9B4B
MVHVRKRTLGRFLRLDHADLAAPPPADGLPTAAGDPERARLELRFRVLGATRPLLAFGTGVEIISPAALRDELAHTAREIATMYTADGKG